MSEKNVEETKKKGPARSTAYKAMPDTLVIIGIDEGDESHALWDRRVNLPLDTELKATIAKHGVIEPVVCHQDGDRFIVVDGRQRVRCAREVNRERVAQGGAPIQIAFVVREGGANDMAGVSAAANVRVDEGILDRAHRVAHMETVVKMSVKEIAAHFGVSPQAIGQWKKLLRLDPDIQTATREGRITATAAAQLSALPVEKQKVAFFEIMRHNKVAKPKTEKAEKPAVAPVAAAAPVPVPVLDDAGQPVLDDAGQPVMAEPVAAAAAAVEQAAGDDQPADADAPGKTVTAKEALQAINDAAGNESEVPPGKAELKRILKNMDTESRKVAKESGRKAKAHPLAGVIRWVISGDPRACPELATMLAELRNRPEAAARAKTAGENAGAAGEGGPDADAGPDGATKAEAAKAKAVDAKANAASRAAAVQAAAARALAGDSPAGVPEELPASSESDTDDAPESPEV